MSESMMYIFLAIIAVLTVAEIVMAILLIAWRGKLNEEADTMHRYSELIVELFHTTRDYEKQLSERMLIFAEKSDHQTEMYKEFCKVGKDILEQYKRIIQSNGDIVNKYNNIAKSYNIFLDEQNRWYKGIEDKYSASYEQFKLCTDRLKELRYQVADLANMSTEDEYTLTLHEACDTVCLDCPYDACKCDTCPVYSINHKNDIPDGIEVEAPPDPEAMRELYENGWVQGRSGEGG